MPLYASLLVIVCIMTIGFVAWRHPWLEGSAATGARAIMVAATLAGAALCALTAKRGTQRERHWRAGWMQIAAALLISSLGLALSAYPTPTTPANTLTYALLALQAVLLCAGIWFLGGKPDFSTARRWTPVADALLLGGALTALAWWLYLEPMMGTRGTTLPNAAAAYQWTVALATVALIAALLNRRENESPRLDWVLLSLGTGIFTIVAYRGFVLLRYPSPRGQQPTLEVGLLALAPLLIGAAALWQTARQDDREDISSGVRLPSTLLHVATFVLPCVAVLAGTWHLNVTARHSFAMPGEAWWAALIAVGAVVRHALAFGQSTAEASRALSVLHGQTASLRDEVAARTHQLSTLHAVSADLNNTLDVSQVVRTGLDRMMDALHADGGAFWLRLDYSGPVDLSHEQGQPAGNNTSVRISSAASLLRDLERSEMEQRVIDQAKTNSVTMTDQMAIEYGYPGAPPASNVAPTVTPAGQSFGKHWRMVRVGGAESELRRSVLHTMHMALEEGGLERCTVACATLSRTVAAAHIVAIRWKGEVIGAMGALRRTGALEREEKALLESLGLELGVALQNAHLYQEASRLADRDSVTDLLNHRAIQQQFNSCLARARRTEGEFVVVMMDLNNFKFFNDTYGHPVGDKVLRTVAGCLHECCRISDVLGRFGGDEFIAILLDTDAPGAEIVCSRIAESLAAQSFEGGDGRRIPISLSFGAALFPQDGDSVLELLTVADTNLYEAKHGGKSLVMRSPVGEMQERRELKDSDVGGSFGVLDALVTAIDNKDQYTRRHSEDVTNWAILMARELSFSEETQRAVRICGLLHDVGKIAVPDSILRKPGRLGDEEFKIMQQHPVFGALIVKDVPNLPEVLGGIRHHHERFDGKGYPDKLAGENIPLLGRLLAVPDCFSAMTTDRPYRKALTWSEALDEIERGRGTQFDPAMAEAFMEAIAKVVAGDDAHTLDHDAADLADAAVMRPRSVADAAGVS